MSSCFVSRAVLPGMHVDILISGNPPGQAQAGTLTKTLLQNIEVLSAGQNIQEEWVDQFSGRSPIAV